MQLRNALGVCIPKANGKDKGLPNCLLTANPVNAGTGDKAQQEAVYSTGGISPLNYLLTYGSSQTTSQYKPAFEHGLLWATSYDSRLSPDQTSSPATAPAAVYATRSTGQLIDFRLSGSVYVSDADISHKLLRLTDGSGATTGWRLFVANDSSIETYDTSGKLISITDRNGLVQTLAYDGSGRLASVTDTFGRTLTFTYDGSNRVATLTQPDSGVVMFGYDTANNLNTITYPDTKVRSYIYNEAANTGGTNLPNTLTGLTDEDGNRFATWTYDTQGRAVSSQHAGGAEITTLSYGSGSTTVTDALGTVRVTTLQTILNVVRGSGSSQPGGSGCGPASSALTYDGNGNVASQTDFNGNKVCYGYDTARNLETKQVKGLASSAVCSTALSTPPSPTTANPVRTVTTQWHSYWRLPVKMAEPLKLTTLVYNGDTYNSAVVTCAPSNAVVPSIAGGSSTQPIGVLCQKIEQPTTDTTGSQGFAATASGTARTWAYTYNPYGQVLTANGPRTDVADTTIYTYYDVADPSLGKRGNVATVTDALGHVTSITAYDANGRPLTIVDPNGVTTTLTYDPRGRLTGKNIGGETTGYQYDGVGQLTRITLPDGATLNYVWDAAHRLTTIADTQGNQIVYTLDAMGNRTREEVRDPANQLTQLRQRVFDALNRLYQDIGAQSQTTTYAYDANGNLTSVIDPLNHSTLNGYDALNRLIAITDPNSGLTHLGYNGQDKLTQVTDPRSLATSYTVDGLGNLTQQVSPDSGTTQNTYDAAGNVLTRTDAKGQTTSYAYDALNRVTQITFNDNSKQSYAYDQGTNGIGRLGSITETDPTNIVTSTLAYAYDALGRVTSEVRTISNVAYVTAYQYSNGDLTRITYPSGKQIDYILDSLGRIGQVTLTDNGQVKTLASTIQYQPFGGVKSYTNGAGQIITRSIDQDGRIASYTLGSTSYQVGYDAASRITYQTDTGNAANTVGYGYDSLDRLTSAVLPNTTLGYGYDANGNRINQTVGGNSYTYQVNPASNRLTSINTAPPKTYSFDANGSIASDGSNTFSYDTRGRLSQANTAAGVTSYQINALGQRIRKTNTSEDTLYHYDRSGHLITETDPAGQTKREYFYLNDLPLAVLQ